MQFSRLLRGFLIVQLFVVSDLVVALSLSYQRSDRSEVDHRNQAEIEFIRNLRIPMLDGVILQANLFIPTSRVPDQPLPTVIFANSWTLNEYEYFIQARNLAKRGYAVLSYATRGFGGSGGKVSVASSKDITDVSQIIDYLLTNWSINKDRIAFGGVSYGAGIGLLAIAKEKRLKTVVAMSGWGNLEKGLFAGDSVKKVWIDLLIGSGQITGRLDRDFITLYNDVKKGERIKEFRAWAQERSPETYVESINERRVPVFLSNNYYDRLFSPNQVLSFFSRLSGPKKLLLNEGVHASAEGPGLVGIPNRIWNSAHRWLDYWLLDKPNGIMSEPPIALQNAEKIEYFEDVAGLDEIKEKILLTERFSRQNRSNFRIPGRKDSGATSGIPLISSVFEAHTPIDVKQHIWKIHPKRALILQGPWRLTPTKLRGRATLSVEINAKCEAFQAIAYLYDVNPLDEGRLISHAVITSYEPSPFAQDYEFEFSFRARDLEKYRRLVVVIDAKDPLYALPPGNCLDFEVLNKTDTWNLFVPNADSVSGS